MPPQASDPPEEMSCVRKNLLSQWDACVCHRGHTQQQGPRTGTEGLRLFTSHGEQPHCPSRGRRGHQHRWGGRSAPAAPHLALPNPAPPAWGRIRPCRPQPSGTPAPGPDYCWVSKKTLKGRRRAVKRVTSVALSLSVFPREGS